MPDNTLSRAVRIPVEGSASIYHAFPLMINTIEDFSAVAKQSYIAEMSSADDIFNHLAEMEPECEKILMKRTQSLQTFAELLTQKCTAIGQGAGKIVRGLRQKAFQMDSAAIAMLTFFNIGLNLTQISKTKMSSLLTGHCRSDMLTLVKGLDDQQHWTMRCELKY